MLRRRPVQPNHKTLVQTLLCSPVMSSVIIVTDRRIIMLAQRGQLGAEFKGKSSYVQNSYFLEVRSAHDPTRTSTAPIPEALDGGGGGGGGLSKGGCCSSTATRSCCDVCTVPVPIPVPVCLRTLPR